MKEHPISEFYDALSGEYHTIYPDWDQAIKRQSKVLDALIKQHLAIDSVTVLDCACGIGTQAIGLAQLGYQVRATDLSPQAVKRATLEAEKRSVSIRFGVAAFAALADEVEGTFDAVIACDNALPHLIREEALSKALESIFTKVKKGGLFLASVRDYDDLLRHKPRTTQPNVVDTANGWRTISFQVWDWQQNNTYTLNHYTLRGNRNTQHFETTLGTVHYRAYRRAELSKLLLAAGFTQVKWLMPKESGYFQPIVLAFNSED